MRQLATDLGLKAGQLFSIVRNAVTGKKVSPPLFGSIEALGRDEDAEAPGSRGRSAGAAYRRKTADTMLCRSLTTPFHKKSPHHAVGAFH